MSEVNYDWVKEQFVAAKVKKGVGLAVLDLLKAWEPINVRPEDAKQIFEILSRVALGHALVTTSTRELWLPGEPGKMTVGDIVRIKHDAFNGPAGAGLNGRVGMIAAIRSGDIIFNSTDELSPKIEGAHYRPQHLDKRWK